MQFNTKVVTAIDRVVVWVLLVGFIIFMYSGYAMTRGWMEYKVASFIHLTLCPVIVGLSFCYHSAYGIHLILKRKRTWTWLGKAITGIYTLGMAIAILATTRGVDAAPTTQRAATKTPTNTNEQTAVKAQRFTASQLAKYNGLNGNPAYVAIDGKVYDVSSIYRGGSHFGCYAGQDVSAEFKRFHPARILMRFPQVGTM